MGDEPRLVDKRSADTILKIKADFQIEHTAVILQVLLQIGEREIFAARERKERKEKGFHSV